MVALLTGLALALALAGGRFVLPRLAHRSFLAGDANQARRRYRAIAWMSWSRRWRMAARVSIAGTYLAHGRWADGAAALDAIDERGLDPATRAGWLNNRAYAALRLGAHAEDAERALSQVRDALRLRPDVPALLHTEALALLALGRAEDAIRLLESLWDHAALGSRLESERAADLARAWAARGELAYAADYARRARRAAPDAPWHVAVDANHPEGVDPTLVDDAANGADAGK